jgi:hypothetical protein
MAWKAGEVIARRPHTRLVRVSLGREALISGRGVERALYELP